MAILLAVGATSASGRADPLGHDRLRAHVASLDVRDATFDALDTSRLAFSLTALVPGWGTYRLEKRVFGGLRPSAVIGDWLLGGLVPAALVVGAIAADDPETRSALAWTAAGLYVGTRVAILVVGNLHLSAYRRALTLRFAATPATAGVAFSW